jgi:hypothetical protein
MHITPQYSIIKTFVRQIIKIRIEYQELISQELRLESKSVSCWDSNGRKTGQRRGFIGEPRRNVEESTLRYNVSDEGNVTHILFLILHVPIHNLIVSFRFVLFFPQNLIEQNQQQARQILIQNPMLTKALFQVFRVFQFLFLFRVFSLEF